jgi:hypothetical protein
MTITSLPTIMTPTLNLQGHAHRRGVHGTALDAPATQSSTAAKANSTSNLFSNLLDSVEQTIGAKPAAASGPTRRF